MAFKFIFKEREYGPKKLFLYSLPAISHIYNCYNLELSQKPLGKTLILFLSYFNSIEAGSDIGKDCADEYGLPLLFQIEYLIFTLHKTTAVLFIDKDFAVINAFTTSLSAASMHHTILSKKEEEIDLKKIAKYALCQMLSLYLSSKVLGLDLHNAFGSKAAFFLSPIAGPVCSTVLFRSLDMMFLDEERKFEIKDIAVEARDFYAFIISFNTIIACGSYAVSTAKECFSR